jgi:hypothetical protein
MPITPNIIQTAKQTVKAQVVMSRTDRLPDLAIFTPIQVAIDQEVGLKKTRQIKIMKPSSDLSRLTRDTDIMTHLRKSA